MNQPCLANWVLWADLKALTAPDSRMVLDGELKRQKAHKLILATSLS